MPTVTIRREYVELLEVFGGVEKVVDKALKKYLIDVATSRIEKSKEKIRKFERKYGLTLKDFQTKLNDPQFLKEIEEKNPAWEEDYEEWEYWSRELEEWMERLKNILIES